MRSKGNSFQLQCRKTWSVHARSAACPDPSDSPIGAATLAVPLFLLIVSAALGLAPLLAPSTVHGLGLASTVLLVKVLFTDARLLVAG